MTEMMSNFIAGRVWQVLVELGGAKQDYYGYLVWWNDCFTGQVEPPAEYRFGGIVPGSKIRIRLEPTSSGLTTDYHHEYRSEKSDEIREAVNRAIEQIVMEHFKTWQGWCDTLARTHKKGW